MNNIRKNPRRLLDPPDVQLVMNGYTSAIRNVYLMLSISIALFTFSSQFKSHYRLLQFLAFILICYSVIDGAILSIQFNNHINYFSQLDLSDINKILIQYSKERVIFVCISFILFIILASVILLKKIL